MNTQQIEDAVGEWDVRVRSSVDKAGTALRDFGGDLRERIQERPGTYVLAAFAVGVLFAQVMRKL